MNPLAPVDARHFRNVAGHLASGVTVITTLDAEDRYGMTASSVTSLSADPPMMLACLNNAVPTADAVSRSGRYAVNILGERHGELAHRFAVPSEDKFAGVAVREGVLGVPLLDDAIAHIECEVVERVVGGTHSIFLGRVVAAAAVDGQPLTYFRGGFGRFALARDDAAYQRVRDLVLTRSFAVGAVLDVSGLASQLELEEPSAFYALARLAADGLVRRGTSGGYVVTPFDVRTSDATFDARLVIELGVIEQVGSDLDRERTAGLREAFEAMAALLVGDRFVDFDAYLEANYRFHRGLVELAGLPLLAEMFEGLAIKQVMTQSFGASPETSQRFIEAQRGILEGLARRDAAAAQQAAREYSELAKERARELLNLHGGAM